MHPYELYEELTIDQAAQLLAYPDGNRVIINEWVRVLDGAIKRGELPTHDRAVPLPLFFLDDPRPRETYNKPHVWREDLRALCAKLGIPAYPESPSSPKKRTSALQRKLAALDQWLAGHPGQKLDSMEPADRLLVLRGLEPFRNLQDSTIKDFWKKHGKKHVAQATSKGRATQ